MVWLTRKGSSLIRAKDPTAVIRVNLIGFYSLSSVKIVIEKVDLVLDSTHALSYDNIHTNGQDLLSAATSLIDGVMVL